MNQEFTMSIPNTPENYETIAKLQDWSSKIPTLYFLDTCCVSHIKDLYSKNDNARLKAEKLVAPLSKIDFEQNGISYFPALIEKSSNPNCTRTVEQFIEEVDRDFDALEKFFHNTVIYEDRDFCKVFVQDCKGSQMETSNPEYIQFLETANSLGLHNKETDYKKRLKLVETLCNQADQLNILKFHPVVLAVIGSIYGCSSAQSVLKFKGNADNFDANNALNDIQLISRIGIFSKPHNEDKFMRRLFITNDAGLRVFFNIFTIKNIESTLTGSGSTNAFTVNIIDRQI